MLEWIPRLGDNFPDAVDLAISLPTVELEHSQVLHELRSSGLIDIFPNKVAMLLIYLAEGMCFYDFQSTKLAEVRRNLPSLTDQDLEQRLDEKLASLGVQDP